MIRRLLTAAPVAWALVHAELLVRRARTVQLADLRRRVRDLEARVAEIEAGVDVDDPPELPEARVVRIATDYAAFRANVRDRVSTAPDVTPCASPSASAGRPLHPSAESSAAVAPRASTPHLPGRDGGTSLTDGVHP